MRDDEFVPSSFAGVEKPARGTDSVANVEDMFTARQNIHSFLERKVESPVQGEIAAQNSK